MSNDGTIKIVENFRKKYPNSIKIYKNHKEWQAIGRNIAIRNEKDSNLLAYIDGHCIADKNWLKTLYNSLIEFKGTKVAGIGSIHLSPEDESFFGKIIEQIFSTIIGGFGSSYIPAKIKKEVNTASFVLYRREALEKVEIYDEKMKYGEDFTLNYKLRKSGYKLFVEPKAIVYYYKRKSIVSFGKQMYNYGVTKAIISKNYPSSLNIYHYFPSILVILLGSIGIVSIFVNSIKLLFFSMLLFYFFIIFLSSLVNTFKEKKWYFVGFMPVFYGMEHFSYSIGFLRGLFKKGW